MGIANVPNPEELGSFRPFPPGWWVGWSIGWWTGWWNPFQAVLGEIDREVVGRLTVIQGEFLAQQVEILTKQAALVQQMGRSISEAKQK